VDSELTQLGFLLLISGLVAMLTRRLGLPYTVGLVLAGMALYFFHIHLKWHLSKDLIFSVFLPPLVFEAALFINWQEFKKDLPVIALLATVGVVFTAAVTAVGMHFATQDSSVPRGPLGFVDAAACRWASTRRSIACHLVASYPQVCNTSRQLDIDLAAITQGGGWRSPWTPLQYAEKTNAARSVLQERGRSWDLFDKD
jgi:Kef-type K+ transport system membrane component KefB